MLILTITKDLNKLLQNGVVTTMTPLRKSCGVVVMTINVSIMFVVAVLCAEYCWAYGASEVLNMILSVQSSYIRAS
jgi:hypothetical protein